MRSLLPFLLVLASSAQAQYWQQVDDFPGTARDDAAAFAIDTHAYFGTGMETGWGLTSNWWMLDVVGSPQWQAVPDLPAEPRQYCAGFSTGGRGFVFGGLSNSGPLNELWSYSEDGTGWMQLTPLPAPGRYAATAFTSGDKAYVVGGVLEGGAATNECWCYDPATDLWVQVASIPGAAIHRAASFEYASFGYVIGGADSANIALAETWKYTPAIDQWSAAAPLPEPRYAAAPLHSIDLGIIGGASSDTTFHANGYIYDPVLDSWSEMLESLPYGTKGASSTYAEGGGGYYFNVIGTGIDNDLVRHKEMFTYGVIFGIEDLARTPLMVYPNPATNSVTMIWPETWPNARVLIHDALGRIVLDQQENSGMAMDVSQLSPGRYVVEAQHGSTQLRGILTKLP